MRRIAIAIAVSVFSLNYTSLAYAIDVAPNPDVPSIELSDERIVVPTTPFETTSGVQTEPVIDRCAVEAGIRECRVTAIYDGGDVSLPAEVERVVREVGLPALTLQTQPGGQTLVNVPTIFHTDPAPFAHTVELLGRSVDIEATGSNYRWNHGDGTSHTTTSPGRPYPHADVTHQYTTSAEALQPSVDVTYVVRYRVDGGPWQQLDTAITAPGPTVTLRVAEAAPVLTQP